MLEKNEAIVTVIRKEDMRKRDSARVLNILFWQTAVPDIVIQSFFITAEIY